MDDLKDFESQLMAIDDWLTALEERAAKNHVDMGLKQLGQARARLGEARKMVGVRRAFLCKSTTN